MIRVKDIISCTAHVAVLVAVSLFFAGCAEKSADQVLADAKQERDKGNFRNATIQLKSLLQKSPDNAEARYLLGVTYADAGDAKTAEAELRRAIERGHEHAKVAIGKPLLMMGAFQKVLEEVPLDLSVDPKVQAEIFTLRARAALGLGRHAEGRELLDEALAKQPEFADALLAQAQLAAWERKPDAAAKLIERALASAPKSLEGWLMKGDLARSNDDLAGALEAYGKAVGFSPENILARLNIVELHIAAANLEEAKKQLAQIRKLAPNLPLAKYFAALIEFRQKKLPAARDAVLEALKAMPDHLPSVFLAGRVEYALGSHGQAQKHFERVVERVPGYLFARKMLVASLAKSGQTQRAIDVLQPGVRQAPEDAELMVIAGEVYLQSNDFARAAQFFEKAAQLAPKSTHARTGLGLSRLLSGETDRALADLESAVGIDTERYRADMLLVMSHLRHANYDQALQAMQSLEKKQPKNPLTYNLKGMIYVGRKDQATARKHFEHALELNPSFVAAAINLARLDLQDKKPADARGRFEAILKEDKDNVQALLALADMGPRIGATSKEVIDWLLRARSASPGSPQPALMLARAYARSGDRTRALEIAQQAAAVHPDYPGVLDTLGLIQIDAGLKQQALATYNKLVALQPKSPAALLRLAMAQVANADQTGAVDTLRKAVSLQPNFIEAHAALANLELKARRYPTAMKIAQQIQKQFPKSPTGFVIEGDILMQEKKFLPAAKAYETGFDLGKSGAVLIKLHEAYTQGGKPQEGEERLTQRLKESPDDAVVRLYAAETSRKRGEYKSAIGHYEWLLEQQPDNLVVLNNLAWSYYRVQDPRALETAERAYQLKPDNPAVADTLGWILVEKGSTTRGLELLQKAVAGAPKANEPRYHLAQALIKAGDRAKARQELERLLADAPDSRYADDARKMLSELRP